MLTLSIFCIETCFVNDTAYEVFLRVNYLMQAHSKFYGTPTLIKFRWSNRSRSTNRLITWSNRLLIDFFNSNSWNPNQSSQQNRLNRVQFYRKNRLTFYKNCSKLIEKVKINWLFWYILIFSIQYCRWNRNRIIIDNPIWMAWNPNHRQFDL